ncbi:MAG: pseudouridine synthase [Candidatus Poseidoniales archaeon]|jgi:16S rRNA pseudouridine516 synthase|nr:pseudouridine synthase [Candidatus Poseidoniales archaeon]|tara:strand:+ start:1899 stop:2660 length:762 start_codon:yes stop_codon:yes gene_type:complete
MKIRLHQFLSRCGAFTSKKEVKNAIWSGDIAVNGSIMKDIKFEFNPNKKVVTFREKILTLPTSDVYFLLNKPVGFICSRLNLQEKELGKKSIYELFRHTVPSTVYESLITVGRLDEDTTGFLLVTSDGKLVEKITNPKNHVAKKYLVETKWEITEEEISQIKSGVSITISESGYEKKYVSRPAIITLNDQNIAVLTIDEGKKRQIRRMFDSLGNRVISIHRLAIGNMVLSEYNINLGEFQEVTIDEINLSVFQ